MTDPRRGGLCQNRSINREILFAIYRAQFAHRPKGCRHPADGDLLLLAVADFDCGSGDGVYCCERDRLV